MAKLFGRRKAQPEPTQTAEATHHAEAHHNDPVGQADVAESGSDAPGAADGPFDVTDAPEEDGRIDLGSLRLPGAVGINYQLEVDQQSGRVLSVTAAHDQSSLQMHPYAARRSRGEWDSIRKEILDKTRASGGQIEEIPGGEFGPELHIVHPDGAKVRILGVDGPRWFLRAAIGGVAVDDPSAAESLFGVFKRVVVVRGDAAMAPRDPLPLTMPAQARQQAEPPPAPDAEPPVMQIPQRGPEMTETR